MEQEQSQDINQQALLAALALGTAGASKAITNHMFSYGDRDEPDTPRDSHVRARRRLNNAANKAIQEVNPSFDPQRQLGARNVAPGSQGYPATMYSGKRPDGTEAFKIHYNQNIDRLSYAHELGHVLSQNKPFGHAVSEARFFMNHNPKVTEMIKKGTSMMPDNISRSLAPFLSASRLHRGAQYAVPAMLAAAIPGDNDVITALAANLALSSPVLLDEALGTKEGLKIMKDAKLPATAKQRMRLAGSFGTYLSAPLMGAMIGNMGGNLIDEDV